MAKRIVLWRHGQTNYNLDGKIQGQIDIPLNQTGLQQAGQAAEILAKLHPELIVCSDLERAVVTGQTLAQMIGQSVRVDSRLRERAFGKFEGLNARELKAQYGSAFEEWRTTGECEFAGVEERTTVGLRVAEGIKEHAEQVDETLVVVSHGSALTQGMVVLMGLDPLAWQGLRGLDNCHWSVMIPSKRFPQWRLRSHNIGPEHLVGQAVPSIS